LTPSIIHSLIHWFIHSFIHDNLKSVIWLFKMILLRKWEALEWKDLNWEEHVSFTQNFESWIIDQHSSIYWWTDWDIYHCEWQIHDGIWFEEGTNQLNMFNILIDEFCELMNRWIDELINW
jgi:hypothetical protein